MTVKEISSLQHPIVKKAVSLRLEKNTREEAGQVLVAGKKLIEDIAPQIAFHTLFYTGDLPQCRALETIRVSEEVLKKITGLAAPDGLAALAPLPKPQSLDAKHRILILDQVSDPGNLGTLWRTAFALGWDGIWLMFGCVDPFNDKALRAAKGATFFLPYEYVDVDHITSWMKNTKSTLICADLEGTAPEDCQAKEPLALILGNEGEGVGAWTKHICQKVTIPMVKGMESINVASAGAILLYTLRNNLK
jgi:TrmH family RNA methyltransferase